MEQFDVVIVGGGHAGVEAALASARLGARTALMTHSTASLGRMSCNPSIGGLGKGHLVREVDAFDGVMGRAADAAAIHYRLLNRAKGSAVRGPRVQADRRRYAAAIQDAVARASTLCVIEAEAAALIVEHHAIAGVESSDGRHIFAPSVVLATGTFLGGRIFRGEERLDGGRHEEAAATVLARQLRELDLPMARLKTGTPPRLDGRTIDWSRTEAQLSDVEPWTMSPMTRGRYLPQLACAITRTNGRTHDIIRQSLHRSPLFSGAIEGGGPRYCPSIEDKIHRFGDRDGHQIFLEPEGLDDHAVYPNGISTSLPVDVQEALVRSIAGLERAVITVPGYAVEYDYLDPRALDHRLAVRSLPGLFCAGQINGTTGYEEAAGQGLVAGLNAAAAALGREPLMLDRSSSYLAVMIDDLVLQGVTEPYRMLTSRAEFRLSLRADNAETRLGPVAEAFGCLSEARRDHLHARMAQRSDARADDRATVDPDIRSEIDEDRHYAPYVQRQQAEVSRMASDRSIRLPDPARLLSIPGLSNEMKERLAAAAPETLDQARRVRGITPAALTALWLYAEKRT